jgi:hypothetical protein
MGVYSRIIRLASLDASNAFVKQAIKMEPAKIIAYFSIQVAPQLSSRG